MPWCTRDIAVSGISLAPHVVVRLVPCGVVEVTGRGVAVSGIFLAPHMLWFAWSPAASLKSLSAVSPVRLVPCGVLPSLASQTLRASQVPCDTVVSGTAPARHVLRACVAPCVAVAQGLVVLRRVGRNGADVPSLQVADSLSM